MTKADDIADMKAVVEELMQSYRGIDPVNLFTGWVLHMLAVDDEGIAISSVVNRKNDRNIDGIYVSGQDQLVTITQTKYRIDSVGKAAGEKRNDLLGFAELAEAMFGTDADFQRILPDDERRMDRQVRLKCADARQEIQEHHYKLHLVYATLGKVSEGVSEDAQDKVGPFPDATLDVLGWREVFLMLSDYVHWGIGPLVREITIPVRGESLLAGPDDDPSIESWVFTVAAEALATIYKNPRNRLFARNVRAPLGQTSVARAVKKTLDSEPERFWFFNNGVTIVCDKVTEVRARSRTESLRVRNPQIINGQQTTVSLAGQTRGIHRASVIMRVIKVPRDTDRERTKFNDLVSKIVVAANWQNQISASDLRSNEPQQIEIAHALYRRDYAYIRKRGADPMLGRFPSRRTIRKEDVAKSVADCILGPGYSLKYGESALFSPEEVHYDKIFRQRDPDLLLSCHWMRQDVAKVVRGQGAIKKQARPVVLYLLWDELDALTGYRRRFVEESELWDPRRSDFTRLFMELAGWVFRTAEESYDANAGRGADKVDPFTYFKNRDPYPPPLAAWGAAGGRRRRFDADKRRLLTLLAPR